MDFGPQKLRGEATSGEVVTPIKINKDGTLQVRLDLFDDIKLYCMYWLHISCMP